MIMKVPFTLRERKGAFTADYNVNSSVENSGFDALNLPFDSSRCLGYPTLHAYFDNMEMMGYRRYCAWIQLVERREFKSIDGIEVKSLSIDVSDEMQKAGIPFFAYGYPAELYDAPCCNLGNSNRLLWTAYTYLVDIPSRMNHNKLSFLAGISWGYTEDTTGPVGIHELKRLSMDNWNEHYPFLKERCPDFFK